MGTVGLSFGSPTSGAGFDVSTTVSSIMANLENVETPWKSQITTINSQDTVLSSLGTLLSNLSTDLSSLTDATGVLSEKEGSSSNDNVLTLTSASTTAVAGTHTVEVTKLAATSSGYLSELTNSSDTLAGSISIQVGSGTAQTITLTSSDNTLSGLASAINSAGVGVTASVLTDATGSRLSLVSGTSGAGGNMTVTSAITDTTPKALSYADTTPYTSTTPDTGTLGSTASASDTLAGSVVVQVGAGAATTITLTSADNTLSGLAGAINTASLGVTASVVTNATTGVSSISLVSNTNGSAGALTVTSSLTDTTPTAVNYNSAVTGINAALTVDGVSLTTSSNTVSNLIPGVTFQLLSTSDTPVQVVIANYNSGVESTFNSLVTDYNSLVSAMNTQVGNDSSGNAEPLYGSPTLTMLQQDILGGISTTNPNGYLDSVSTSTAVGTTLAGSITIQVGTAAAQTVTMTSGDNTLSGLAAAINTANIGVTAAVVTDPTTNESTLTLASQTTGSTGALSVSSAIKATSNTALTYTSNKYTSTTDSSGTLGKAASASDTLSGSIVLQVGSGTTQTIKISSSNNTLTTLASGINSDNLGVTASVVTNSDGTSSLSLTSQTAGSTGALSVTSSLYDVTGKTTTTLGYTTSSDITSLSALGISVNNDGTISLDATALDSVLNTDFSGVQGLFQNANSWGMTFANMLTNAGTSSTTGILELAETSNSSIESTLNADISREDMLISSESKSLTAELNSANEIMQQLPSQLSGVNELYSAITGYNSSGG
jgi:flagellar hook-associated protein 2